MLDLSRITNSFNNHNSTSGQFTAVAKMPEWVVRSYYVAFRHKQCVYTCAWSMYLTIIIRKMD